MITTRTAERLAAMAREAGAIAEAVYEHDQRETSDAIAAAAQLLASAAAHLEARLAAYARAAAADEPPA